MRFQVPQYIEVEDKIFGPLTIKQFVYLAGGAGMLFFLANFSFIPGFIRVLIAVPIIVFALALAFYKYNNKPFISFVENAFRFTLGNKLYIWRKEDKVPTKRDAGANGSSGANGEDGGAADPLLYLPKLSDSKLKDITLNLDISKENENPVTMNRKM